jgi:hypothetical protein
MLNMENYKSVNAVSAHSEVSEKYSFIPTTRVINLLQDTGWKPVKVQEKYTRKLDNVGFQKHLIEFENVAYPGTKELGNITPRILLVNSHNRGSAFQLTMGLFRLVCSNGMVIADSTFASHSIRHIGFTDEKIYQALLDMQESIPMVLDKTGIWSSIQLSRPEQIAYAESAVSLRFDDPSNYPVIETLITPRRQEDRNPTLWNTFNTVQEKLTGGMRSRRGSIRKIKGLDSNVRLNKALWELTDKMASFKMQSV